MDTIVKTIIVYIVLLILMRLSGRRTLAQITTFDFILLLVIGGTTQRALLGQDYSVTNALLVVITLILTNVILSLIERDFPTFARLVNGAPLIVVEQGQMLDQRLRRARLTQQDIMAAARRTHGIERVDDIKYAILEASGNISIIPRVRRQPDRLSAKFESPAHARESRMRVSRAIGSDRAPGSLGDRCAATSGVLLT